MKNTFPQLTALLILLWLPFTMSAQNGTIHLISSIDNINDDVKAGCAKDYNSAVELFSAIARDAHMNFQNHNIQPFDSYRVEEYIEHEFRCGQNDVVIFMFSGHGNRYDDDPGEFPWPYLYYCHRENTNVDPLDCELDLDIIRDYIVAKRPRLAILISDSCNNIQDDSETNADFSAESMFYSDFYPEDGIAYQDNMSLFTRASGLIMATASSPGEQAFTDDDKGSHFSNKLFHYILDGLTSKQPTSWREIFYNTKMKVEEATGGKQSPAYDVFGNRG